MNDMSISELSFFMDDNLLELLCATNSSKFCPFVLLWISQLVIVLLLKQLDGV